MADKEVLQFEIDSNIGELSKDIDKAADSTKKLDKAADKASGGFGGLGKAVKGVGSALKAAGIENDYGKLRYQLKTNPELRKEVETLFGLAAGYPSGRMEIHHKVFQKNLEPYLFRLNKKGVLELRPQKQINKLIGGLEKHGWKIAILVLVLNKA